MSSRVSTHKGVLIILDGLGDRPVRKLGDRTPLEAARTPNLDRLLKRGMAGMIHPIGFGVPVGTQTGVGLLFGLARADVHMMARGPVEAAGVGLQLHEGSVALRCNFATLRVKDKYFEIVDRRAGRIHEGTHQLAAVLDGIDMGGGITAHLRASTQHRAVLLLTGPRLSDAITDTDPGAGRAHEGVLPATERVLGDAEATRTASVVNAFIEQSHAILSEHPINKSRQERNLLPANGLITRGAGKVMRLRNLIQHLGIRAAVVSGEGTVVGLGRIFHYDIITHPRFTATPETDLALKVEAALQALNYNDLVFLHIKGTDTTGHDMHPERKAAFIEKVDAALAPIFDLDVVIGIASDHSTDSNTGRHTGDPVPVIMAAPNGRKDDVSTFNENACMKGGLGHLSPTAFLTGLLDQMNQMHPLRTGEHIFY